MIFFDESSYTINNKLLNKKYVISTNFSLIISMLTLLITLFMLFDQELMRLIYIL